MHICSNCRQITDSKNDCGNCSRMVCDKCCIKGDETDVYRAPHFLSWYILCSNCLCAGVCLNEDDRQYEGYLNRGDNKCDECKLQYCDRCFDNTKCNDGKSHK